MFDNLTREESLQEIQSRVSTIESTRKDPDLSGTERIDTINALQNEIRELWYHIYDLEGKPYER